VTRQLTDLHVPRRLTFCCWDPSSAPVFLYPLPRPVSILGPVRLPVAESSFLRVHSAVAFEALYPLHSVCCVVERVW